MDTAARFSLNGKLQPLPVQLCGPAPRDQQAGGGQSILAEGTDHDRQEAGLLSYSDTVRANRSQVLGDTSLPTFDSKWPRAATQA